MFNTLRILLNILLWAVVPLRYTLGGPHLSVDLMLPQELVDSLNTEDDVKKALQMGGQIIEFSTQTTETTAVHAYPTPTLSHDSLSARCANSFSRCF